MSTNELEKHFFDMFGIEPKSVKRTLKLAIPGYDESDLPEDLRQFISSQAQVYHVYPQITDPILLELICILNTVTIPDLVDINIDRLKKTILEECIRALTTIETPTKEEFIDNIRTLFKGGNNG